MKRNTLVYGINKDYHENINWIMEHYEVKGAFDQDQSRLPPEIGINKNDIAKKIHEFDTILVTADPVSIVDDLVDVFFVPLDKIDILYYEIDKDSSSVIRFYGNDNEDAALLLLIEKLGYSNKVIKYLEIGTNDPMRFNVTYNFYKQNGEGYIVDALPSVAYLAKMLRPRDKFIQAAVSDKSGEDITFYACKSSTVSSLHEKHHEKWNGQSHNSVKEIKVPLMGINELLGRMEYIPDLLVVDAEGEDEKIIRGIDYTKYRPAIIMVEANHMNCDYRELVRFMNDRDYFEYASLQQNVIFVTKEETAKL